MRIAILEFLGVAVVFVSALALFGTSQPPAPARCEPVTLEIRPSPEEVEVIGRRTLVKNQLARRVIAERTPLLEAAEWFREANGEEGMDHLIRSLSGRSVREKLCHQVLLFVAGVESDMAREGYPPSAPRVSAALRAEFDRRLAAGEFPPEPGM